MKEAYLTVTLTLTLTLTKHLTRLSVTRYCIHGLEGERDTVGEVSVLILFLSSGQVRLSHSAYQGRGKGRDRGRIRGREG